MCDLILRKATVDDSEFAYQTKKAAFRNFVEQVGGWDEGEQRRLHERRFAAQDFRVLQVAGVDVGVVAIAREADCVRLNQLFILPEHQDRGIGKACIRLIIEEAAALEYPVRLHALKVNSRAILFFDKLGFTRTGDSETHVLMERPT